MAKKRTDNPGKPGLRKAQQKKEKPGPIEGLVAEAVADAMDEKFSGLSSTLVFDMAKNADKTICAAAQLARGAKNYVQGSHNPNAGKWVFVSKSKLNELKKALRKAGVNI